MTRPRFYFASAICIEINTATDVDKNNKQRKESMLNQLIAQLIKIVDTHQPTVIFSHLWYF